VVDASAHAPRRWVLRVTVTIVVLALAAAAGLLIDDRVADHRRADAAARAARTPAVSAAPTQLGAADDPAPAPSGTQGAAPLPDPGVLAATLGPLWSADALGANVVGSVVDADTGQVLAERSSTTGAAPASTAKLLTCAAALTALGSADRFTTAVVAGAAPGQIVLVGGGDPTLSAAPASQPTLYPNAARISDLATQVGAALAGSGGAGSVTSILVDSSLFTGATTGPGWDPSDAPSSYASPITATMVDGGRDDPSAVIRSAAPDLAAGQALAEALGVASADVTAGTAPPGAAVLGKVSSASVLDIVQQALLDSDNVLAEVLSRQVAIAEHQAASFDGGVAATRAVLGSLSIPGLDPAGYALVDGSGLSPQDRVTPAVLAALLRAAVGDSAQPQLAGLIGGLPVAGWDGTLAERYQPDGAPDGTLPGSAAAIAAQGIVHAKTGTLTGVSALAGVLVDADGRLLVFALIADQVSATGTDQAEQALDTVAGTIAECGCR
jgi:D-alanyl-D-alanine carboxypeptidase/D-alanyl-D-alanine-endopeptidase (penicillin-binding protein 4)